MTIAPKPWPTVSDVADALQTPLASFTPTQSLLLQQCLDAAEDQARRNPDYRNADTIPPKVWRAVQGYAADEYWMTNPGARMDAAPDITAPATRRTTWLFDMGVLGRSARARIG